MIDFTEIADGDAWEAFCRDYLVAKGLTVEVPPGRGPDGGRDLLVREQLRGVLATRPFTWLVSCKHYATSGKAVGASDEINITDRLEHHCADGFIGFYSTAPSAALVQRLKELRDAGRIQAFEIYDGTRIAGGFHDAGLSGVLLQYLPESHTRLRPVHPLVGRYEPLPCDVCGRDLLRASVVERDGGVILFGYPRDASSTEPVERVEFACRGECDRRMEARLAQQGMFAGWDDISDYCNPLIFIRRLTGHMSGVRSGRNTYSDAAHEKLIKFYLALSQRTLRQTTDEDLKQLRRVMTIDQLGL